MIFEINPDFKPYEKEIRAAFHDFDKSGTEFIIGKRNKIKLFPVNQKQMNVKSFKIPNKINQFIYKYFRKSKARRSFEYANILLKKGIGTPTPIAFQENFNAFGITKSFYASEHQDYELTFRELVEVKNFPDEELILRQFTQFCYKIHDSGIEFKDHSPGNTLIKKLSGDKYEFYLVDLNRMNFHNSMSIELRMKNLSRLTPKKEMVKIISDEYAKIANENPEKLFDLLWKFTSEFQTKYHRKHNTKNKLKTIFK